MENRRVLIVDDEKNIRLTLSQTLESLQLESDAAANGEEALAFSGIARVGNMQEWPKWTPTADIHKRIEGLPQSVPGGPDNPLGARALYLYQGNKDTLFRIHGTNQPEYIGASISSGCIRMTNEDVIDLYSRAKQGSVVVVLEPKQGDSPFNSKMALQGASGGTGPF